MNKEKYREYHNRWQNNKYATDEEFREMKKKLSKEWRKKNLEKFRKYQREYRKKLREKQKNVRRTSKRFHG